MKPRIKKNGSFFWKWECEGRGIKGKGMSASQAYLDWRIQRQQRKLGAFQTIRFKRGLTPKQLKLYLTQEKQVPVAPILHVW